LIIVRLEKKKKKKKKRRHEQHDDVSLTRGRKQDSRSLYEVVTRLTFCLGQKMLLLLPSLKVTRGAIHCFNLSKLIFLRHRSRHELSATAAARRDKKLASQDWRKKVVPVGFPAAADVEDERTSWEVEEEEEEGLSLSLSL
jgi:hypothetical protein